MITQRQEEQRRIKQLQKQGRNSSYIRSWLKGWRVVTDRKIRGG